MTGAAVLNDRQASKKQSSPLSHTSSSAVPLSQQLRKASRQIPSASDTLVAVRLLVTCTNKRSWASALGSFWHILAAIEDALDACKATPDLKPLQEFLPRIRRKAALEADLQTFYGDDWKRKVGQPSSEVQTYLERVRMLVDEKPWLLWAHAYTQHMGILARGQFLRNSVRGSLQIIHDEPGTACFEFKEPVKKVLKDYEKLMDSMEPVLGGQRVKELIAEQKLVFQLNNAMIRSFPVTAKQTVGAVLKLLPPEVLLLIVSAVIALVLVLFTRSWVKVDPDSEEFADIDFVMA